MWYGPLTLEVILPAGRNDAKSGHLSLRDQARHVPLNILELPSTAPSLIQSILPQSSESIMSTSVLKYDSSVASDSLTDRHSVLFTIISVLFMKSLIKNVKWKENESFSLTFSMGDLLIVIGNCEQMSKYFSLNFRLEDDWFFNRMQGVNKSLF